MKTAQGEIYKGKPKSGKPDCTMTVSEEAFDDLVTGKLMPQNVSDLIQFIP